MGKKAQIKRLNKEEEAKTKKEVIAKNYYSKNPWALFWKRTSFYVVVLCFLAIMAYPILRAQGYLGGSTGDGAVLHTSMGDIEISFYKDDAPNTVKNFQKLTKQEFYKNMLWHRIIKGFVIQTGDPNGDGTGGPGYQFNDEISKRQFKEGVLGMANAGENTNGSQFFIVNGPTAEESLDGKYTAFAEVTKGMDVVQKISAVEVDENDKPLEPVYLISTKLK